MIDFSKMHAVRVLNDNKLIVHHYLAFASQPMVPPDSQVTVDVSCQNHLSLLAENDTEEQVQE